MLDLVLLAAVTMPAAPVPKHRPSLPLQPIGEWRITWCGCAGPAIFRKDGSLTYFWGPGGAAGPQQRWQGVWELKGDDLLIWTWPDDVMLEPGFDGRCDAVAWPVKLAKHGPTSAEGRDRCGAWRMDRRK